VYQRRSDPEVSGIVCSLRTESNSGRYLTQIFQLQPMAWNRRTKSKGSFLYPIEFIIPKIKIAEPVRV